MDQSKEVQLAYEIATILDDVKSIDWHIGNSKRFPESFLREKLNYVLSKPSIENRAAYYNSIIQRYGRHPRG